MMNTPVEDDDLTTAEILQAWALLVGRELAALQSVDLQDLDVSPLGSLLRCSGGAVEYCSANTMLVSDLGFDESGYPLAVLFRATPFCCDHFLIQVHPTGKMTITDTYSTPSPWSN